MSYTARVLVVGNDPSLDRVGPLLGNLGYYHAAAASLDAALEAAKADRPDVVIARTSSDPADNASVESAIREMSEVRRIPVVRVGEHDTVFPEMSDWAGVVTEFLPSDFHDVELSARLTSLVRLNTMQTELRQRAATVADFGVDWPIDIAPPGELAAARILVVAASASDQDAIAGAFKEPVSVVLAENAFDAMARLLEKDIDAAIISMASNGSGDSLTLCTDIRSNPSLFNLPVIVITDAAESSAPSRPLARGASDVVVRPFQSAVLSARVGGLIRQNRYRYAMHQTYRKSHLDLTTDSLTGLHSFGFLHAHLARQMDYALRYDKHLALGFLDVRRMRVVNDEFGFVVGDRLLRQLGLLVANLIRGEDLAARFGGEKFCVVQPETTPDDAEFALNRIVGVVNNTEFAIPTVGQPIVVRMSVGGASIAPGDTPAALIGRARKACLFAVR